MISNEEINRLNKIPILEIAQKLGLIVNRNNKSICFTHEEKTPSLSFNSSKNYWKCFGCGEGGGVISLVMKYYQCSFYESVKWLSGGYFHLPATLTKQSTGNGNEYLKPNSSIYEHFLSLCDSNSYEILKFFYEEKKIKKEIIEQSRITLLGITRNVVKELKTNWGIQELIDSGLFVEKVNKYTGEVFYSLLWYEPKTAIVPFFNEEDRITYLKGRLLIGDRLHLNLKNVTTDIYNRRILNKINKGEKLFICEGESDTLSALSMGLNAIGILGALSFKKEYTILLNDYQLFIVPDNDKAGVSMMRKVKNAFLEIEKNVEVIYLTGEKDLNDYYAKQLH